MKNGKPIIGLVSSYERSDSLERVFLPHDYLNAVRHFGGIPLLIPVKAIGEELEYLLDQCDGLILTGGNDIDPALYGEKLWNDTVEPAPERDEMEAKVQGLALARKLPILGICRGIQMMNVYFGGTLYQDIPTQLDTPVKHRMEEPGRHGCILERGTPLYDLVGEERICVNTHHHQAVKAAAPGFSVMGRSEDGVIEAIYDPQADFIWAVQWHPEKIWESEPASAKLFAAFVEVCKKSKA